MHNIVSAALFSLAITAFPAAADTSKKIFAGKFDGITKITNNTGAFVFYSPVRMKINNTGTITGTAYNTNTSKLLKVSGKINKVQSLFGILFTGKASGTFSDGTKWSAEVEAQKGSTAKIISGKAWKGGYSGSLSLTNL